MDDLDLPVCKRCCFCVPLRYGILMWGYWKLATALIVLTLFILITVEFSDYIIAETTVICVIVACILAIEIVIHIIFIVGAHKKNVKLLCVYYYYGLFMWVVSIIMAIVCTALIIRDFMNDKLLLSLLLTLDVCTFSFYIVVQVFLLLSLRSEMIKIRSNCPYRFVKNDNDPEGTINSVVNEEDNMSTDNGTARIL